jgi:hypothetical protein
MPSAPPHRRTKENETRVRDLVTANVPLWKVAKLLGCQEETIRRNYRDILDELGLTPGAKPYEPSEHERKQVAAMAAIGIPQEDIALFIGIDAKTLKSHFDEDLRLGSTRANAQVGGNLFKAATGDPTDKACVTAMIWWTKARMNWRDSTRVEQTGADGGPIKSEQQVIVVLPSNDRDTLPDTEAKFVEGNVDEFIEHHQGFTSPDQEDGEED